MPASTVAYPNAAGAPPHAMLAQQQLNAWAAAAAMQQQRQTQLSAPTAQQPQQQPIIPYTSLTLQQQQVLQQLQQQTAIQHQQQCAAALHAMALQQQAQAQAHAMKSMPALVPQQAPIQQPPTLQAGNGVAAPAGVLRPRDVNAPAPTAAGKKKTPPPAKPAAVQKQTAVLNEVGELVETDNHRLAQRRKQICYGKVTEGYANYTKQVKPHERDADNLMHPSTPRVNQVCSKRDWDTQMSQWRRALHFWDCELSEEAKERLEAMKRNGHPLGCPGVCCNPRKEAALAAAAAANESGSTTRSSSECGISDVGSRSDSTESPTSVNALKRQGSTVSNGSDLPPRRHWTNGIDGPDAVKVKFLANGASQCNILKAQLSTSFGDFSRLIESKLGPVLSMEYVSPGGQAVKVADDKSLHTYLVVVKHSTPAPKMVVQTWGAVAGVH